MNRAMRKKVKEVQAETDKYRYEKQPGHLNAPAMPFQGQRPHFDRLRCLSRQTPVSKLSGTGV